jgi:hypothetical protein
MSTVFRIKEIDGNTSFQNITLEISGYGMAIFIAFPEKSADIPTNQEVKRWFERNFGDNDEKVNDAGHAGVIIITRMPVIIDGKRRERGDTKYFDFGRYDDRKDIIKGKRGVNDGVVRSSKNVRKLVLSPWEFEKTDSENVTILMEKLSKSGIFKGYGKMTGALAKNLDYLKMFLYAELMENKGIIPFGGHETSTNSENATYCAKFARGVGEQGGVDWDFDTLRGSENVIDVSNDFESAIIEIPNK